MKFGLIYGIGFAICAVSMLGSLLVSVFTGNGIFFKFGIGYATYTAIGMIVFTVLCERLTLDGKK